INDFNGNGTLSKILTRTYEGKDVPVFLKHEMQDEMPMLKKQNLRHEEYAKKSISDLIDPKQLEKSKVLQFNYSKSCIAFNKGNGQFSVEELPVRAQLSSVNAILCKDLNNDGHPDLILAGNYSGFIPQLERLDASYGDVFMNDSKGKFKWMPPDSSGLVVRGDVRDIKEVRQMNGDCLLFLRNNDFPVFYQINNKSLIAYKPK
ncbi:MAG TPA: hypothetical protein VNS32_26000, partial [Flavisolibacter sp.]|nr:hypothetical protein [Flavisolibacter sp.]